MGSFFNAFHPHLRVLLSLRFRRDSPMIQALAQGRSEEVKAGGGVRIKFADKRCYQWLAVGAKA